MKTSAVNALFDQSPNRESKVTNDSTTPTLHTMAVFQVVEKGTLKVMSTHNTRIAASRKVDRLDNAYGCYHYFVRSQLAGSASV